MYGRTRRALIASLLVSSVACGGAFALAPTAGAAAAPAASCTVTPSADGTSVTISGEGFTAPRNLNDGETTQRLNVDANGNFLLKRFQKNVDYTVLAVAEDQADVFVNCRVVKAPNPQDPQQKPTPPGTGNDREQGRLAGGEAGRAAAALSCSTRPEADRSAEHSDVYWQSWTRAANRAFDAICNRR
ncbi:hypothetical protein [Streptomyces xanthophaeus]|uniref:Uncharacterized protein n=1 Tax=Streptomyces xanthophaeus TaxID=67385 RepID=A0A919GT21_9ACTN|nr:hypothetical protein [Streptomyces xanthophaeus]GHI83727.1 hypothetical protein Sxan_10910 [Streptomyces xanthophaeus]